VSFRVTNTGKRDGAEIARLYVAPIKPPVDRPLKELKGFQKIYLKAGESKKVTISLDRRSLAYYNDRTDTWDVARGAYGVMIGSSSQDIELQRILVKLFPASLSILNSSPVPGAKIAAKNGPSKGANSRVQEAASLERSLTVNEGSGEGQYSAGTVV
jgi:beta-glucosidase